MKIRILAALAMSIGASTWVYPLGELEKAVKKVLPAGNDQKKIFVSDIETKQQLLEQFKADRLDLLNYIQTNTPAIIADLEEVQGQLTVTRDLLRRDADNELQKKRLALLNEKYQLLKQRQQLQEQELSILDQIVKQIADYLADPEFNKYRAHLLEGSKGLSFESLQEVHQKIIEHEKLIENLFDQEKNANAELENRKRSSVAAAEAYQKRKEENEQLVKEGGQSRIDPLWLLQDRVYADTKLVDDMKLKELVYKIELIKLRQFVGKSERDVLRSLLKEMKSNVQVSEADVAAVKDEFEKRRQKAYESKRSYDYQVERLGNELKNQRHELELLADKYAIALDSDLDRWAKEPKKSVKGYLGLCEVGAANEGVLFTARRKDLLKSSHDLEDERIKAEELIITMKETFHKIRYSKLTPKELAQELKHYDTVKSTIKANLSLYNDRKNAIPDLLDTQKKGFENIKHLKTELYDQKNTLFKDSPREFNRCFELLNASQEKNNIQVGALNKMLENYNDIINLLTTSNKQIDFIVSELSSTTMWSRPQYAVSWEGLKSLVPDIELYFANIYAYLGKVGFSSVRNAVQERIEHPGAFFKALLLFMLLVFLIFMLRRVVPQVINSVQHYVVLHPRLRIPGMLLVALGRWFLYYFGMIAAWLIGLALFKTGVLTDPYLQSLFYLCSIPYVLYLIHRMMIFFDEFNEEHGYVFMSRDFEFRWRVILAGLIYSTILLYFFKKAFVQLNYSSELPIILTTINAIMLQVGLIALIGKEQVLARIPRHGSWQWFHEQLDRYYYPILITLITIVVMSHPNVGFGQLVLYVIRRVIASTILIVGMLWAYRMLKDVCSYLFFISHEDEASRERFINAKTWYGITIICMFVSFVFFGMLLTAKIWGWPDQLAQMSQAKDVIEWLQRPFSNVDQTPVSVWLILKLVAFVCGGIAISFTFNHFVVGKVFDMLLIDPGIQNTVASITYYVFFALSIIIGFNVVGLTSLLYWLLALVAGIAWIIKDPVSDFVSYFIILVQRPVKVGDLVRLEDNTPGVIRKITARSVIVRCRNSTTVIIPNSAMINRSIVNWNYSRDFIAFDDIQITISYDSDALLAQKVFYSVLTESPYVLKNPKPIVRLDNFAENGYRFMVRGYLSSNYTHDQWDIASDIRLAMIKKLQEHGIKVALPVRIISQADQTLKIGQ